MRSEFNSISVAVARALPRRSRAVLPWLAAAVVVAPTWAAAPAAKDEGTLDEVIVTAQYRQENLQDTALAITAVSGEQLDSQGIQNVEDLGLVVPNASIRPQGSFAGPTPQIGMRGVQTTEFIYTTDPGVGVYIDDIYFGSLTGGALDLLDLERVEVLRGPQGTLFGKNSLGGAIRLISKTAKGDDTGSIEATYGTSNRLDLRGTYDFKITDNLFARVTGISKQIDGYQDVLDFPCEMKKRGTPQLAGTLPSLVPTNRENAGDCKIAERGGSHVDGGRLVLRYVPTDQLEMSLSGDYTKGFADGQPDSKLTRHSATNFFNNLYSETVIFPKYGVRFTADDRFLTGNPFTTYAYPVDPVGGKAFPPGQYSSAWGSTGKLNYKFSDTVHFDAIVGYRTYQIDWMGDGDQMPIDLNHTYELQGHKQWSYEARLSGTAFEKLDWTTGVYRYSDHSVLGGYVTLPAFAAILPNFNENDHFSTKSNSAFAHGQYHFTDAFSLTAGVRYTDEKKVYAFDHAPYLLVNTPLKYGSSHTDWKAALDYRINEQVMVYTSAATGFRSDGSQPRPFTPGQQKEKVPAEELTSYEVGMKLDLLNRRLRVNLAVFQDDYNPRVVVSAGTQCNFPSNPDPGPVFRGLTGSTCPAGTEVGDSATKTGSPWLAYASAPGKDRGAELELTASPTQSWAINGSIGLFDFNSAAPRTIIGPNGQPKPNNVFVDPSYKVQAKFTGSLGMQYKLVAFGGTLTPRFDWFFQGSRSNGVAPYLPQLSGNDNKVPAYGMVNARLTFVPEGGKWEASLEAENLLDKFYWYQLGAARSNIDGSIADNRTGSPGRPREIALTLRRNFN
jgi:iron complex outermembrane receptor protein